MATKLKAIILALIISLCNFNTIIFAANINNNYDNSVITELDENTSSFSSENRRLQNTSKNIYILGTKCYSVDDLIHIIDTNSMDSFKASVKVVKKNDKNRYTIAYDNINKVYDYYKDKLGIAGIDGKGRNGLPIFVLPNYEESHAFFITRSNKGGFIGLGDHNGRSYAVAIDAIGHEYTHLVLGNKYGLNYSTREEQSLHEGIADYFGCIIEGKNNWKIADDVLGSPGLRNIAKPSSISTGKKYKDALGKERTTYPDNYSKRYAGSSKDIKHSYINSTIVSHLLYTIQSKLGGTKNDQLTTGKLVLRALANKSSHKSIEDFAQVLYEKAYSSERSAVKSALKEVGLDATITLNANKCEILVNKSKTLKATISPKSGVASKRLNWTSSNNNVATVKNGVVTGVSKGTATITSSIKVGNTTKKATCKITVNPYKRTVPLSVKVPSNYTGQYYIQILDENNKVVSECNKTTGSRNYNFTYTLNSQATSYKRKVRVVTNYNKYTSPTYVINKNTIDKNITAIFKDKKVTITQK